MNQSLEHKCKTDCEYYGEEDICRDCKLRDFSLYTIEEWKKKNQSLS